MLARSVQPRKRIYDKLGVETRTAPASVAMQRVRELAPT
jgi:DNA-binding CsgD family transcriptional regulator